MQRLPAAHDVLPLLGGLSIPSEEVDTLLNRAAALMRTYTHGVGFTPEGVALEPDLASIIVASVARALLNPESALSSAPSFSGCPGTFEEWTTAELRILRSYASRAASGD